MKPIKYLAATAALMLAGSISASASTPTWSQRSYGYYNANGPYAIEYWVDAYDSNSGLTALSTAGWDEVYNQWRYADSTGNGSHRVSQGWGYSYDGYSDGQIWITDATVNYYYTTEFTF